MGPMGNILGGETIAEGLVRKYGSEKALSFYDRKMKRMADAGKKIQDFWDEQANKGWEAPNPDIVEARWSERPLSKGVSAVYSGLTSIGVVVGTTYLTKSPQAGLAILAASETGGMYSRLRDENVRPDVASKLAQMAGAWTYVTEKIGFKKLLAPTKRTVLNLLKKPGWEGAQEVVEGMGHNLLEYFGYNYREPSDIPTAVKSAVDHMMDGWMDNLVGGIGAGGMVSVTMPGVRPDESGKPKGYIRLYRGEERVKAEIGEETGISFSPDIEYAKQYANIPKGGKLYYIDVPAKILTSPEYEKFRLTDEYTGIVHEIQLSTGAQTKYGGKKILKISDQPIITPPTVEELTKKPLTEIEPQTQDHAIGHQYGLTNEQVDNRLNEADLRYRELKLKKVISEAAEIAPKAKAEPVVSVRRDIAKSQNVPVEEAVIFRDIGIRDFEELVDRKNVDDPGTFPTNTFFANTPNLALGQKGHTGVLIEFEATNDLTRSLKISKAKPGLEFVATQGQFEVAGVTNPKVMFDNIKSVILSPETAKSIARFVKTLGEPVKSRFQKLVDNLEKQGWIKQVFEDGSIKYTKKFTPTKARPAAEVLMQSFFDHAKSKGYTTKVVGDYAFENKKGNIIRLVSGKGEVVTVWEQGVGRYEITPKPIIDERTPAETDELAFLKNNRTNIEAILNRETQPITPPKIKRTKKNLLVLGHKIAREAGLTDEEYRDVAEMVTGKRSMKDMSMKEKNEFVSALEESYGTPKELTPEDYDMPITVAGRATSMREVRNDAAKTTKALVDRKKVPATIKIGFGKTGAIQGFKNFFFGIDNTPPYHLARILDGGTEGIFSEVLDKGIEAGRKNSAAHTRSVMDALLSELEKAGITDADLAKMSKAVNPRLQTYQMISKGAATEIFTIEVNGQNFEMTMANLIDIYLISNQEAGMRHLTEGGLVIEGVETGALSEEQIADLRTRIEDNPKALKVAVTVLKIGEQIWKPSINQVSQRLEGVEIATEPDWWGLEVYMPKRLAGKTRMGKLGQFGVNLIEDKGILKDRTRSTAPLVLRDALRRFSVFESAIAEYAGMAEASRTSRTLLNDPSIAAALDQKGYGDVRKRILKIHEQAQSLPAFEGNFSAWFAKRLPSLYRAVLFFNPRVVASQYTSAFNYGAYVSPEFMTSVKDGLSIENSLETLALSDVAWDRFHMGHSSLELGEATQSDAALRMWTGGKSSDINKAGWAMKVADLGALTAGMEMAKKEYDLARTGKLTGFSAEWWLDKDNLPEANTDLWRKVQEEGENADPEERQTVEQWRRIVTDRAEYLWQRTQPSWDRWNRSTLTSQKGIRRLFLLFRSFHEKSLTIFNEAKMDYGNSAKTLDDKTAFAQKTGSVLTGYTVNMFLRLAIMAAITRELKEPVKYFEEFLTSWTAMFPIFGKVLKTTVNRFVDTLAGAKTTYIGEVLESYPVRVVNMVLKSPPDMAEATAHVLMGENEEAEEAFMRGIGRFAEGVGTLSGVPVPEIKRVLPEGEEESTGRRGPPRRTAPSRRGPK
jgi:hypothetical protein